jgi:hypothetical protein
MDELVTAANPPLTPSVPGAGQRGAHDVDALRDAASDLAAVLPTRIEAAVVRAMADAPAARQLADLQRAVALLSQALEAERLGRLGDVEVLVDLVSADADATRNRVARLDQRVTQLAVTLDRLVSAVEQLTPVVASVAEKLDRRVRISVHTEPGAEPFAAPPAAS